jgi:hypothetical protein
MKQQIVVARGAFCGCRLLFFLLLFKPQGAQSTENTSLQQQKKNTKKKKGELLQQHLFIQVRKHATKERRAYTNTEKISKKKKHGGDMLCLY